MVIEQTQGFADQIRANVIDIMEDVGINTYTLSAVTITNNAMGRVLTRSLSTSTIKGFLNKVGPQDKQYLDLGILNIGDAVFYAAQSESISENDELTESGETDIWMFTKRIDHEKIQGDKVFQSWGMTKKV